VWRGGMQERSGGL